MTITRRIYYALKFARIDILHALRFRYWPYCTGLRKWFELADDKMQAEGRTQENINNPNTRG